MAASAGKVAFLPRGDYDAETTYRVLDFVMYRGSSYVAKKTTAGNPPTDTEYWQVLARGSSGAAFGVSGTEGGAAAKEAATAYGNFELGTGADVIVKFANGDTAGNITLNVDGTGARAVKLNGEAVGKNVISSSTVYEFVYDGTDYVMVSSGGSNAREISRAEYEALSEDEQNNGTEYFIPDMNGGGASDAKDVEYDNTESGLGAENVQDAIDELAGIIGGISYDPSGEKITIPSTIGIYDGGAERITLAL